MARGFQIPGECMVLVKGASNSAIANLSQLGLCQDSVDVSYQFSLQGIKVNAWGNSAEIPPEEQCFLSSVNVTMSLVHFDEAVLKECVRLSLGGAPVEGQMPRTGALMGGQVARFAPGNNYIGLNLTSPVAGNPYCFWYARLANNPFTAPMGTERQVVALNWKVIPYTNDPWGGGSAQPGTVAGTGSQGATLWTRTLDT